MPTTRQPLIFAIWPTSVEAERAQVVALVLAAGNADHATALDLRDLADHLPNGACRA
jgi:hypothetical protein